MDLKTHFQRAFAHTAWANTRLVAALRATPSLDPEILRLFTHVLTTERIYLERMRGLDPWPQNFWPETSIGACATLAEANREDYATFVASLDDDALGSKIAYRNSKGLRFETLLADMLAHVVSHGAYHRGQIAFALRRASGEPVDTDFITFSRETG
jgi:uncharacterized damage-inducible protein DinB